MSLLLSKKIYGPKGLPNIFAKQTPIFFKDSKQQGSAAVYIVDISLISNSKTHMLQLVKQLHEIAIKIIWEKLLEYHFYCFSPQNVFVMKLVLTQFNQFNQK